MLSWLPVEEDLIALGRIDDADLRHSDEAFSFAAYYEIIGVGYGEL